MENIGDKDCVFDHTVCGPYWENLDLDEPFVVNT